MCVPTLSKLLQEPSPTQCATCFPIFSVPHTPSHSTQLLNQVIMSGTSLPAVCSRCGGLLSHGHGPVCHHCLSESSDLCAVCHNETTIHDADRSICNSCVEARLILTFVEPCRCVSCDKECLPELPWCVACTEQASYTEFQKSNSLYHKALQSIGFSSVQRRRQHDAIPERKRCIDCQQQLKGNEDTLCGSCVYNSILDHIGFTHYMVKEDTWKISHPVKFSFQR